MVDYKNKKGYKMNEEVKENSLNTLRNAMFNSIMDVRNGNMEAREAEAVAKIGHQIVESYKVEIEAVKVMNDVRDDRLKFASNMKAISNG